MRNSLQELSAMDQLIIDIVKNKNPSTVEQLINLIQLRRPQTDEEEIVKYILHLERQGKIVFKKESPFPHTLTSYLGSPQAYWY